MWPNTPLLYSAATVFSVQQYIVNINFMINKMTYKIAVQIL